MEAIFNFSIHNTASSGPDWEKLILWVSQINMDLNMGLSVIFHILFAWAVNTNCIVEQWQNVQDNVMTETFCLCISTFHPHYLSLITSCTPVTTQLTFLLSQNIYLNVFSVRDCPSWTLSCRRTLICLCIYDLMWIVMEYLLIFNYLW